jgi:hypothetical protein
MGWIDVRGDLVEDHWPELARMPAATPRLAMKLGLLILWFADVDQVARRLDAEHEDTALRGLLELLVEFRDLVVEGVTGVGLVAWGEPGWLNWCGAHITDDERLAAWLLPGAYRTPPHPRASAAGQVQEAELDSAMLLLGLTKRIIEELASEPEAS